MHSCNFQFKLLQACINTHMITHKLSFVLFQGMEAIAVKSTDLASCREASLQNQGTAQ